MRGPRRYLQARKWEGTPFNAEPAKCAGIEFHDVHSLPPDTVDFLPDVLHRLLVRGDTFVETGWHTPAGGH